MVQTTRLIDLVTSLASALDDMNASLVFSFLDRENMWKAKKTSGFSTSQPHAETKIKGIRELLGVEKKRNNG